MEMQTKYMKRCLQLAELGRGYVSPNPMVGAILVYKDEIVGEGYHQFYGQAHAEVNCIKNIASEKRKFIPESTLYVSLEPCVHHGKTPPCADLIISQNIQEVVIGCRDAFALVSGKGIQHLQEAGIKVSVGLLEEECKKINERFFTFHEKKRPYILLKWAQSCDGYIAGENGTSIKISNPYTDKLVHKWRSEEAAIMVGTNTALLDNPSLTNRLWTGLSPVRILLDSILRVPADYKIIDGKVRTIIFNTLKEMSEDNLVYVQYKADKPVIPQLLTMLHQQNIQSVMVEGGAMLLQSFIDNGLWDEARIITSGQHIYNGVAAPHLKKSKFIQSNSDTGDRVDFYKNIAE
jgi:diaminohydroxyphosphoribosylaminopyrimidine deaminase / 5-amino-6-(5-phosphoribosylamino)uracil reductase